METKPQAYNNIENTSLYVSAPTSPTRCSSLNNTHMMHFYSVPTSPLRLAGQLELVEDFEFETSKRFRDFEFETSKRFRLEGLQFDSSPKFDTFVPMAFADELFSNGHVVPLKPPPRLVHSPSGTFNHNSNTSSPRTPISVLKIPFARRSSRWNDGYDPFAVALEKVKEEKRDKSLHRRSRSLSPFRTTGTQQRSDASGGLNQQQNKQMGNPLESMPHQIDPKKSTQMVLSPKGPPQTKHKGLPFGNRVGPLKVGHEGTIKEVEREASGGGETKKERGKGFLGRYASFRREKNQEVKLMKEQVAAAWKRLSLKLKEKSQRNTTKEVFGEPKMEITTYRPKLALCLSFRMESSRKMMYSP